ncbi:hypothetical protein M405DRAFT_95456 [Rhizopogon salebrosus TDB-379]|nr:hypothetical protein M405DRAFT_95456 [Rhizopogon salebrosus TDB-379]
MIAVLSNHIPQSMQLAEHIMHIHGNIIPHITETAHSSSPRWRKNLHQTPPPQPPPHSPHTLPPHHTHTPPHAPHLHPSQIAHHRVTPAYSSYCYSSAVVSAHHHHYHHQLQCCLILVRVHERRRRRRAQLHATRRRGLRERHQSAAELFER